MPKHVKEAYRLLNKSIIRVDQPDIHLDDDEADEEMEIDDPAAEGGEVSDQQVGLSISLACRKCQISCPIYPPILQLFFNVLSAE